MNGKMNTEQQPKTALTRTSGCLFFVLLAFISLLPNLDEYEFRNEESLRTIYDLAIADSTRDFLSGRADSNQLLGTLHRALEDNPLPPFAAIKKHLAPAGSVMTVDEKGFHYTAFGLRRK